jgi:UDPglucose--hexose-1-phosphate uridylyltransferase
VDFKFVEDRITGKWVVLAPRRSKRPDVSKEVSPICPFCPGREKEDLDIYRIGGEEGDANWQVRVVNNKFPFAPVHEVIIHSPDHHKNFGELPQDQIILIVQVYKNRFNAHKGKGQVYIFNNRGEGGGESLPHPHTQLVVIPKEIKLDIPILGDLGGDLINSSHFSLFCPSTSQWPDEIWVAPKDKGKSFDQISESEEQDLGFVLNRIIRILDLRHGFEFPYNFYIYPGKNWYLRIIPRVKSLGGFEVGTGVFVNTQDPHDTFLFIKEHFESFDEEKLKAIEKVSYKTSV